LRIEMEKMKQQVLPDGRVRCPVCKQFRYPEDTTEFDTEKYPKMSKYKDIKFCVGCAEEVEDKR